jgi:mannitol operon transcriptional antiterminator
MILVESTEPLTTSYIAEKLNVSSRTVLRKIPLVEKFLKKHNFKLIKKPGYGVTIVGSLEEKRRLKDLLAGQNFKKKYTPEERQLFILIELLKSKEPIKIYKFESELNVTGGTISSDLDKIEEILTEYNIKLIRKPGLGVYVEGNESLLRKLMVNLIYKTHSDKEVLDILKNSIKNRVQENDSIKLRTSNKLLNMVDKKTVEVIEKIVYKMEKSYDYQLNDSQYVALIVHIALVIERIKHGETIEIDKQFLNQLKTNKEFDLAWQLSNKISKAFDIKLPEDEVGYITMHLMGSRKYFIDKKDVNETFFIEKYKIIKIARKIIKFIESKLSIELMQDDKLLIDLAIHLEPAIKRLTMNMDIRNPLLDQIKENYPQLFKLSKEASKIIEDELKLRVPDTEVGYIALHIGGAVERAHNHIYRIIVVCPSGIGTSRLLSSKIEKEFLNLKVIDTVSIAELENNEVDLNACDFIVSTVKLYYEGLENVVVNPFLLEEDKKKILNVIDRMKFRNSAKKNNANRKDFKKDLKKNINYGKAVMQILNNFKYYDELDINSYEEIIDKISNLYTDDIINCKVLKNDIKKREAQGQFILEESNAIIIHCRSNAVKELNVGIIKLPKEIKVNENKINFVIVLLAPKDIEREYIECISRVSQELFKENLLKNMNSNQLYDYINNILKDFYLNIKI